MSRRLAMAAAVLLGISGAAAADNVYGSIAFSQSTGIDGYSYNYPSRNAASQRAVKYCRSQAADCRVVINFHNACGSLAVGDGNGFGVAWAEDREPARRKALQNCRAYTSGCYVKETVCSGR